MFKDKQEYDRGLFPIGEAAKRGKISTRTLRYYEKLGLIEPDFVDTNGYRYYLSETILKIPIIKYLKIMDFTLEEIKEQLNKPDYCNMIKSFDSLLSRYDMDIDEIHCRQQIVKDWKKLLEEACVVLSMKLYDISVKYIDKQVLIKYPVEFDYDYQSAILDLKFSNFVEEEGNKISGPVMIYYPSLVDRIKFEEKNKKISVLYIQRALKTLRNEVKFELRAGMYATKYHVGPHKDLAKSYKELLEWEKTSDYVIKGPVIERFVADYWSTTDESKYVTELIVPIKLREERK